MGESADVSGTCDPAYEGLREVLGTSLASGDDLGASVAVVHEGRLVADLWGGWCDVDRTQAWEADTVTNVWSTTKTMTNLCALVLADRGEIDLDAPVARYWPEFAAAGKDGVLVRHLLAHTAGVPAWDEPMVPADFEDWERCTSLLAAQAPWWEPGTVAGYHALTQGYLVGEVVRRVTGRTLGTFFAEELAGPLGADFHIGLAAEHDHRVAPVVPAPDEGVAAADAEPGSFAARAMSSPPLSGSMALSEGWRRAEIPAANGHGNARSVATIQSIVSGRGEAGDRRFLSESGCRRIFDLQFEGTDLVLNTPMRHGIGYGLVGDAVPLSPNPTTCFWGGWGGSLVVNDLDAGLTVAYMMNRMGGGTTGDFRGFLVVVAAYEALAASAA